MPRRSKESKLPKSITPADWNKQVADMIKREFHKGLGPDDPGGLVPLALKMLERAKENRRCCAMARRGKQRSPVRPIRRKKV
jgi:hypothetical protein